MTRGFYRLAVAAVILAVAVVASSLANYGFSNGRYPESLMTVLGGLLVFGGGVWLLSR